jgi:hypothetical protein
MRVARLDQAVTGVVAAGAQLIAGPALNSRGDALFAYIRDSEGNLIELVSPEPKTDNPRRRLIRQRTQFASKIRRPGPPQQRRART